jgi:hypothetical protein
MMDGTGPANRGKYAGDTSGKVESMRLLQDMQLEIIFHRCAAQSWDTLRSLTIAIAMMIA